MIHFLVEKGAGLTQAGGEMAMYYAARGGHVPAVRALVAYGAALNSLNPSRDPLADTPSTQSQTRHLMNYGVRSDLAVTKGRHNIKIGLDLKQTRLFESFGFGITDPTFNAVCNDPDGNPVPGIAPAAKQQGRYAAALIKARLNGGTTAPFRYKHAGSLAQIGKRRAVIDFGKFKLRGTLAWWIWGIAHIYFLIGLRNRLSVALSWMWVHARDQRAARLITQGSSKVVR